MRAQAEDPYAAQRAAFLASERARGPDAAGESHVGAGLGAGAKPVFVREKSVGMAYLLWFLCGAISAHRFYLGHTQSAVAQASLWIIGWLMVLGGFLFGALGTIVAAIWMLADAFLIPGLAREANARVRERAMSYTFT